MAECEAQDCTRQATERGYCHLHYLRLWRHGSIADTRRVRADAVAFILALPVEPNGCMIWPRSTDRKGYGWTRHDGQRMRAHRVALGIALGRPVRPHAFACHTCDTPSCVNPAHLYEGTAATNGADRSRRRAA
jgi:hypothetical protein